MLKLAGVPKDSFYHYFGSKEEFGLAVIEEFAGRFLARLDVFLLDEAIPPSIGCGFFLKEDWSDYQPMSVPSAASSATLGRNWQPRMSDSGTGLDEIFLSWRETRRNFHLFCDNFPFPVMLVHKDRTILAVNKAAEAEGYPTGVRCVEMVKREHHKGCLANQALAEQTAKRVVAFSDFREAVLDSYWIPLAGSEELYLHFAPDITQWAKESMIPKGCDVTSDCSACNCG